MAQPSVAREPSMEEILASIRRIIESNDPGMGGPVGRAMSPVFAGEEDYEDGDLGLDDEARELAFMLEAANDKAPMAQMTPPAPEIRVTAPIATPAPDAAAASGPKAISLADLAARVRAAADRNEPNSEASEAPRMQGRVESPVMTGRMAELRNPPVPQVQDEPDFVEAPPSRMGPRIQAPATHALPEQPDYRAVGAEMQAALDNAMRQPVAPEPVRHQPLQHAPVRDVPMQAAAPELPREPAAMPALLGEDGRNLISAMAGQQIARSFEELAAAIDGSQRRSLDEMAEEMLRPMLQEWLDDNLPTLVERLVREEIERVARGPRR